MKLATLAFAAALMASGAAFAASPFVGSWKMDAAKSTLTGDIMTYTKTATGYHLVNGSAAYDFADDGKPHATIADRTVAWTKTPDGGWDVVYAAKGKTMSKAHRTLSADGTTLSTTYEVYRPDGTTAHESDTYTRLGAGTGLEGSWKSTKVDAAAESLKISPASGAGYRPELPTQKESFTTKLDGSVSAVSGPTIPAGATAVFQKVDESKWSYSFGFGGKILAQGLMSVSSDGSTLSDTSWAPSKEDEKSVEVYDRQ